MSDPTGKAPSDAGALLLLPIVNAGPVLPEGLRAQVLALGDAMVPPLLALMEDDSLDATDGPGEGFGPAHAVSLLVALRALETAGAMFDTLLSAEPGSPVYETLCDELPKLGPVVLEPGLRALAEAEAMIDAESILSILVAARVRDERVYEALLALLEREPLGAAILLGDYGDRRAVVALDRRAQRLRGEAGPNEAELERTLRELVDAIELLGGEPSRVVQERVAEALAARGGGPTKSGAPAAAKVGRNDPCPCGSGKKYKKCHPP